MLYVDYMYRGRLCEYICIEEHFEKINILTFWLDSSCTQKNTFYSRVIHLALTFSL